MVRLRSIGLAAARVGAVGFALSVVCYFVVTAQRGANPRVEAPPVSVPAAVDVQQPHVMVPATEGMFPITIPEALGSMDETFLYSSKSLSLPAPAVEYQTFGAQPVDGAAPVFLPSSKSLAPMDPFGEPTTTAVLVPPGEPVFLPSSKIMSLRERRPPLKPGDLAPKPAPKPQQP